MKSTLPIQSSWISAAAKFGYIAGNLDQQLNHSEAFASVVDDYAPFPVRLLVDLGSGGGIPAVSLIQRLSDTRFVLVEARGRRAEFLARQVSEGGFSGRVEVCHDRAETAARNTSWSEACTVVTSRSFGPAAVTAEIATGFLALGGIMVVSDPPDVVPQERWPDRGLRLLGLEMVATVSRPYHFSVLKKVESRPRFPRRVGMPSKSPLF